MANETVTVTQTLDQVTVTSSGATGLVGGGTIEGDLNVGVDGTGHDVKFFGDTAGKYMQWDQSADKLFINGEFEVNGTATTFNSTVITIDDPIFSLGGQQRTDALDDSKDRGIEFFYHDGAQKTGFMGYDDSADAFTFLTSATNSNEIFSGTAGNLLTGNITADSSGSSGQFTAKRNGSALLTTMLANNDGGFQYTGSGGNIFYAGANGNDYVIRDGNFSTDGDLRFSIDSSGNATFGGNISGTASQNDQGIEFSASALTLRNGAGGGGETITLGSNGAVVNATSSSSFDFTVKSATSASALHVESSDGNVGIGTATPQEQLHLYGASAAKMEIESAGGGDASLKFQVAAQSWSAGIDNGDGDKFKINTGSNPGRAALLAIDSAGTVGIGTTAPTRELHLDSGDALTTFKISNSTSGATITDGFDIELSSTTARLNNREGSIELAVSNSNVATLSSTGLSFGDSLKVAFGDSSDFEIKHTGDTYLSNLSGAMYFRQQVTDGDMVFQCDDGSGGDETYFFLDGSASSGNPYTVFPDNSLLAFGSGNDFVINHNGTNANLGNYTGDIEIVNYANDKDIIFKSDDGSGGTQTYFFLDGSVAGDPHTVFPDGANLALGSSADAVLLHNGTHTYFQNFTGDLQISNYANDKDILFRCDDGSGGLETYFFLDGSANGGSNPYTIFPDNSILAIGDSKDLLIWHNATNSYVQNFVGDLHIENYADDKDILFRSDNGSGGLETYFFLDGSVGYSVAPKHVRFEDDIEAIFGADSDAKIRHSGSSLQMECNTGNWSLRQNATNADIRFYSDAGTGSAPTEYFRVDGGTEEVIFSKKTEHLDNVLGGFGSESDLTLSHDGSNSHIANATGDLKITQNANDKDIVLSSDDGSGGNTPYLTLDGSVGYSVASKHVRFEDNIEARFGAGSDFRVYHDGNNNFVDGYNGHVYIRNTVDNHDIVFQTDDGSGGITAYLTIDGGTEQVVFSKAIDYSTTLVSDANHTTTRNDTVILFHSMSTYRYLTLASADCVAGRMIHVKNRDNAEYIYLQTEGSETIDGSTSIIGSSTSRGAITVVSDGSNWSVISKYST